MSFGWSDTEELKPPKGRRKLPRVLGDALPGDRVVTARGRCRVFRQAPTYTHVRYLENGRESEPVFEDRTLAVLRFVFDGET